MSSGAPRMPRGMFLMRASLAASGMASVISVAIKPGAIALQVTLRLANSFAQDFVKPMRPAFDAA